MAVNGQSVTQFDYPLQPGDEVTVSDLSSVVATRRLSQARIVVVHEDDALVVVDKPAGLLTVATDREKLDTLFVQLNEYLRARDAAHAARAFVVHRLDKETSGLVLFAKNESIKQQLQEAWPAVEKTYLAIVEGVPAVPEGTIRNYLIESERSLQVKCTDGEMPGARLAITHYKLLQTDGERSLVEVCLETGRKHQIRVHLAGLGCPVVGDVRYGEAQKFRESLALHAIRLSLVHPITGERLSMSAQPPGRFVGLFR